MPRILTSDRIAADPFGESIPMTAHARIRILGADFRFRSHSPQLLQLVAGAYGNLPRHRLKTAPPAITVQLVFTADDHAATWTTPPHPQAQAGAGLLCGSMDAANFVALAPEARSGVVAISRRLLQFPYYARYELLEFAVCTLASRVQRLMPLHAACLAKRRRGVLLMGDSGAGKTTVAAHSILSGLDILSEDSTFVCPTTGLATGVANYIHVRPDALQFMSVRQAAAWRRYSTTIHRRSGVEKLEVDLRRLGCRLAPSACRLAAIVFVTARSAAKGPLLRPIRAREALARLEALQAYATHRQGWNRFLRLVSGLSHWELRRGTHPDAAVASLQALLTV